MWRIIGLLAIGVCASDVEAAQAAALAQGAAAPNPSLIARDSGVDDDSDESASLDIDRLEVNVAVAGNVAQTTITARFDNTGGGDLEGTFTLQLPDGAVVTGYALDVDGHMIDGVLAQPIKARRAYEEKVRAGIDPGVAEVARGNVFSTRVYPIFHGKGRTVRLTFAAPIHAERGFSLPLVTAHAGTRVHLRVHMRHGTAAPNVVWPAGIKTQWRRTNEGLVNEVELRDRPLAGALRIAAVPADGQAFVTRHPSGKQFVELRDAVKSVQAAAIPRSARVYWDRSLSRRDDRLEDELMALEQYLAAIGLSRIEVVPFGSGGAVPRVVTGWTQAANLLRDADLRGATSFDVLAAQGGTRGAAKVDICLMFTDGVSTIDARPELEIGCPLYIITSAPDADLGYLELLARRNGGAVLRLAPGNVSDVVRQLRWRSPRVVDVRTADGRALDFAPLPAAERGWALVAEAPDVDEVVVRIAGIAGNVVERRYRVDVDLGRFEGAAALWAHDRVSQIAGDSRRQPELEALSRRYSVASPAMSFIVLEAPRDYVAAGIAPPSGYPKASLAGYREAKRAADAQEAARRRAWLGEIVYAWKHQQDWWTRDYRDVSRLKRERKAGGPGEALSRLRAPAAAPASAGADANETLESVVVTGMRRSKESNYAVSRAATVDAISAVDIAAMPGKSISVELAPWNPQRPYLRALDAASPASFARVFEAQEREFGSMPVFYFDVAEWLFRKQRVAEALETLLSALELPARDTETIALVADRLLRYGQVDRAIWLYEEVCRVDPDRPQPARTLALALERRALAAQAQASRRDLERALDLLTSIVLTPPVDQYRGIELVALMDANGIIPRLRALGTRTFALDSRLISVLDVDLRVVIEWNTGASDMDLWVDQPDGERSIYSNPETDIGGRLSNDMTAGYGPEEYLLRRAIDGEYAIRVNVYGNDALNPNGATMVTARLTRNYGRANESTESMELELSGGEAGEQLVGRFKVGAAQALSKR